MSEKQKPAENQPKDMIIVENLVKYYPVYGGLFRQVVDHVQAVDDVSFTIKEGETTSIDAGPPLSIKTEVSARRGSVVIGVAVLGRAGEKYSAGVRKGNRRQGAPTFEIKDKSGKVLAKGDFRYG